MTPAERVALVARGRVVVLAQTRRLEIDGAPSPAPLALDADLVAGVMAGVITLRRARALQAARS